MRRIVAAAIIFPSVYHDGLPKATIARATPTLSGACVETNQACTGVKNQPNDGYNQLWNSLQYLDSGVVAFTPGWLSDIHWWQ